MDYQFKGREGLCGVTSLCMIISEALGKKYTPDQLYKDFPYIEKYRGDYGFGDGLLKDKKILETFGIKYEDAYWDQKAWSEGLLSEAFKNDKRIIWSTKSITGGGHYLELELTKDGKVCINDPYKPDYEFPRSSTIGDMLNNGCDIEDLRKFGGHFYVFDVEDSKKTGNNYTGEKSNEELLDEILKKSSQTLTTPPRTTPTTPTTSPRTRTTTTSTTPYEKVPEIPLYNQKDYADIPLFVQGNLADDGCGIVTYSMALTYLLDDPVNYTPEKLAELYGGTYSGSWGTSGKLFDETPQDYGLTVEKCYPWEGWVHTNKIQTALKNGQPVIAYVGPKTGLTGSGHYVLLTGMNEDGKVLVNDPNGNNYQKDSLKDKFENGFDVETFSTDPNGGFWILPSKDSLNLESSNTKTVTNIQQADTKTVTNIQQADTKTVTNIQQADTKTVTNIQQADIETGANIQQADTKTGNNIQQADTKNNLTSSTTTTKPTKPTTRTRTTTPTEPAKPEIPAKPETPAKPTTPTEPAKPEIPVKPEIPAKPETPAKPTTPTDPAPPSMPSITEPEDISIPVMQRTPEAILKAAQNIENTESTSDYMCNILHESGYFTEEEMNMYKKLDISTICKQLEERGWEKITNTSELKIGDIIIINNGEEIRVYAGNNSWYIAGKTEIQKGNENWAESIKWSAYRTD